MKILITGYGSIGKRHVDNLRNLEDVEIILYRSSKHEVEGVKTYFDLDQALAEKPDAVFITNPTSLHIKTALKAAEASCHLFIEKPLSHNLEHVDELIEIIKKKNLIAMVGYNMRFYPNLKKVKELLDKNTIGRVLTARIHVGSYMPEWRKGDYRKLYSSLKELGGGVVLDLSHEIDYMRWFLGDVKEVMSISDKLSDLEIDTEDTAEIILRTKKGVLVEIHLDYLQRHTNRYCELIGTQGTIRWDYNKKVRIFTPKDGWKEINEESNFDKNQSYINEIKHFIDCIKKGKKPLVNEEDGKKVVEIVLAAKTSSEDGRLVKIGD